MNFKSTCILLINFLITASLFSQSSPSIDQENWTAQNRELTIEEGVFHLDAKEGEGIAWLNNSHIENGTIELEIKGKNNPGRSFVGLAFHKQDDETFDVVYLRPFNFQNPEKKDKSLQYVSHPDFPWHVLRENSPGEYENALNNPPQDVEDWLHLKVEINYPVVKVFVGKEETPSLVVNKKTSTESGGLGFWVGNNSEGFFKNLKVTNDLKKK